ncbi:hypothetical protein BaRGS_00023545 [Batillaria attramentaria]|uniref:Uncharacterized protein n=1 Tax=Batillaria attramentaria TaxID=370345 RepID=A0ABD0KDV6_9CAEN
MGNDNAKQAAQEQVKRAQAEANAKGAQEGRQIMENCYADLKRQAEAAQQAQGESQEWMKSTMDSFLASQSDIKEQYNSLMKDMAEREERNAEQLRNAERRHQKHMEMVQEDKERDRERLEEFRREALVDKERQMERMQKYNEASLRREKEHHEGQLNRLEQNFSRQVDIMKEEKDKTERRYEGEVQNLRGEMDKERSRMEKTLSDREKAMQDERERTERDMKAKEQRMDKNREEVKEMLEKNLKETVNTLTGERERSEKKNEERVQSMKEEAERERTEHKEQEELLRNEKIKSDESYERRIEAQTQQNKDFMDKVFKHNDAQMQLTWETHMRDKQLATNAFTDVVRGLLDDKVKDRESTERREQRMLEWINDRDKRHDNMIGAFMERDAMRDRQLQYQSQPQMIGHHEYPRDYPGEYSRGGYRALPEPRFPALTGGPHGTDPRGRSFGMSSGYGFSSRFPEHDTYDRSGVRSYDQEYMRRQGPYGPERRPGADVYQQGHQTYGQQPYPPTDPYYKEDRRVTRDTEFNRRSETDIHVPGTPATMPYGSQPSSYFYDQGPMRPRESGYPPRREDPYEAGKAHQEPYDFRRATEYRSYDDQGHGSQGEYRRETEFRPAPGNNYDRLPQDSRGYRQPTFGRSDGELSPGSCSDRGAPTGNPAVYDRSMPPEALQEYRPSADYQAFLEESGQGGANSLNRSSMPPSGPQSQQSYQKQE